MDAELDLKWVDKYLPNTVDDLVMNPTSKDKLKKLLASGRQFNITLHGRAGIGKTATSTVIIEELNAISLVVPCSLTGNVDTIRTEVQQFAQSVSFDGRPKVILLDEADGISSGGTGASGQMALRNIMDDNKDCIYILTCNYLNRIIEPLQSRCPPVSLKFNVADVTPRIVHIMDSENITYTEETLYEFTSKILTRFLPDIRASISVLQDCCTSGTLDPTTELELISGLDTTAKKILTDLKSGDTPIQIRTHLIQNEESFDGDYLKLSSSVFNLLCTTKINSTSLSKIADIIYRIDQVIDKEIQFFVLVSFLSDLINKRV